MSQLASAGSNRAAVMRPTLTRQQNLRKEYIYQPGFRAKTDACLTPICKPQQEKPSLLLCVNQ